MPLIMEFSILTLLAWLVVFQVSVNYQWYLLVIQLGISKMLFIQYSFNWEIIFPKMELLKLNYQSMLTFFNLQILVSYLKNLNFQFIIPTKMDRFWQLLKISYQLVHIAYHLVVWEILEVWDQLIHLICQAMMKIKTKLEEVY